MTRLERELARVADADRLLVASDFDGTLSPIAGRPEEARPDPAACLALQAIGGLPNTHAAIVSGRARAVLRELLGPLAEGVVLVGSHGAELEEDVPAGGMPTPAGLVEPSEALTVEVERIAERHPGSLVERKPVGVAFHYRGVPADRQARAAEEVRLGPGGRAGVTVREGRKVVELSLVSADKGSALEELRRTLNVTAAVYLGDDRTDEDAFARLGPGDLGIEVGPGATRAAFRISGPSDVGTLLWRLYRRRADRLGTSPSS
ncbi:MAG: trehalose-phosphatase [Gemmatimonadota bacterium]